MFTLFTDVINAMIPIKKGKKHLENVRRKEDDNYEAGPVTHSGGEQQWKQKQKKLSLPVLDNKEDNHDENRDQNTPAN